MVSHGFVRATRRLNGADGDTCELNPNRIHELGKETRTAKPPLVEGDTSSPGMEGEKFSQVSCLRRVEVCYKVTGTA